MYTSLHYTVIISHPQAYHRGLRYPCHLLLTAAWYARNWWLVEDQNISCTAEQRGSVLPTTLAFLHFDFLQDVNLTTDTGIVSPFRPACSVTLHTAYTIDSEKHTYTVTHETSYMDYVVLTRNLLF